MVWLKTSALSKPGYPSLIPTLSPICSTLWVFTTHFLFVSPNPLFSLTPPGKYINCTGVSEWRYTGFVPLFLCVCVHTRVCACVSWLRYLYIRLYLSSFQPCLSPLLAHCKLLWEWLHVIVACVFNTVSTAHSSYDICSRLRVNAALSSQWVSHTLKPKEWSLSFNRCSLCETSLSQSEAHTHLMKAYASNCSVCYYVQCVTKHHSHC